MNAFLFNSLTLACGGEESTTISWKYSQISDFTTSEELTATYSSSETGLSWLDVDNSKQGYYQCQIGNGIRYIIGLYDQTITTGMLPIDEDRNKNIRYAQYIFYSTNILHI